MPYLNFDISPRVALAAPTDRTQDKIQSTALLISSLLATAGALWMIMSFCVFKNLRTFRHQLILGLALSDCFMAINFSASAGMNVAGKFIGEPEQKGFCDFNGFMTQVFVIQTDYWVLTIAICTYFILADHKHAAAWVQDHKYWLFAVPWAFSLLWAGVGSGTAGYGNIGGWCWFTSDQVRLLVNFVPRWIIIITMLALYARLYWVLYKAHNRFLSFNSSSDPQSRSGDMASNPRIGNKGNSNEDNRRNLKNTRRLKRLAKMMLLYPLAYMIIWTLPTSIRIYQTITSESAPFALQTVDKCCIVIQGFVDAIIYGINETSVSSWRNVVLPMRFATDDTNPNKDPPAADHHRGKGDRVRASRLGHHDPTMATTTSSSDSLNSLDMTVTPTQTGKAYAEAEKTYEMHDLSNSRSDQALGAKGGKRGGSDERILMQSQQGVPVVDGVNISGFPGIEIRKTVQVEVSDGGAMQQNGNNADVGRGSEVVGTSPPGFGKRTFLRD